MSKLAYTPVDAPFGIGGYGEDSPASVPPDGINVVPAQQQEMQNQNENTVVQQANTEADAIPQNIQLNQNEKNRSFEVRMASPLFVAFFVMMFLVLMFAFISIFLNIKRR
jgi:lipopolysaccharide export LptBFGC system permease protein LptF